MAVLKNTSVALPAVAFLLFQSFTIPTQASELDPLMLRPATVRVPFLNLRHGPVTQHSVLDVLKEGRRVTYLPETRSGWVRINAGKRQSGWVMHKFLKPLYEKPDFDINPAPSSNASGNPYEGYAVVVAGALNVRNGPGRHYEVIKVIPGGTHVILDGLQKKDCLLYTSPSPRDRG